MLERKMKPGYKFFGLTGATALLSCSLCGILECNALVRYSSSSSEVTARTIGIFAVLSVLIQGSYAFPPSPFMKRLGSPMPQLGGPAGSVEDEDSEEEEDLLESAPRVEPHITPMNRDQCLAKLLCGMSVPVTGGSSKKNYYNEYANIVSKFFEAFPLDEELQSKESIETYDDYSNEDDGKPTRFNSRRKPMNSSRVEAQQPKLQLFDLALVDVAKPEDLKNRTKKAVIDKVLHMFPPSRTSGRRVARARKIVENLGQKLQTVRQCQSISGCPFTFKQLREKLKKKEAERISSNVPLPTLPGPIFPASSKRKEEPTPASFLSYGKPQNRPKPIPPTSKPTESMELFSSEHRPSNPHKDSNKGDDELEELFGPPKISNRPLGFHQGVDEHYNYDYNSDKPWRPGSNEDNSYSHRPWKNSRPRPANPYINSGNRYSDDENQRLPPRPNNGPPRQRPYSGPPRPRPNNSGPPHPPPSQKRNPPPRLQNNQRPKSPPSQKKKKPVVQEAPQRPPPPPPPSSTTPASPFPKKKISYLSSPYKKPNSNEDDDEGSEDINKVAPVELIGNADAGEDEHVRKTTTQKPMFEDITEATTKRSKKKKEDSNESEYDDDYEDDDYEEDLDDDDYSDEEDDNRKKKKKNYSKKKIKKKEESEEEEVEEDEPEEATTKATTTTSTTTTSMKPKRKFSTSVNFDDETADVDAIWMKLNYATTGGQFADAEKSKKSEEETKEDGDLDEGPKGQKSKGSGEDDDDDDDEEEEDDDEEEDEEEDRKEINSNVLPPQQTRTSSVSGSVEDDTDDEVDEENNSKPAHKRPKPKPTKKKHSQQSDENVAHDLPSAPASGKGTKNGQDKVNKSKKKQKPVKVGSSEEDEADEKQKHQNIMMEIGGRPLVPKPEVETSANAQKTTSLLTNRFKFQFINPYKAAPPSAHQQPIDGPPPPEAFAHGPPPFKSSFAHSSSSQSSSSGFPSASSLPFKFKLNPGPLGNLGGGSGIPIPGFGGSPGSGSVEPPDPHHPPPPTAFMSHGGPNHQFRQEQAHHPQGMATGGVSGLGGSALSGASGLFKINAISSLKNLFKRPGSGFDPMNPHSDGQGPPPSNAFVHRPVGPESSHFNRASSSGSSSGDSKKGTKGSKSKSGKSRGKGKKEKLQRRLS